MAAAGVRPSEIAPSRPRAKRSGTKGSPCCARLFDWSRKKGKQKQKKKKKTQRKQKHKEKRKKGPNPVPLFGLPEENRTCRCGSRRSPNPWSGGHRLSSLSCFPELTSDGVDDGRTAVLGSESHVARAFWTGPKLRTGIAAYFEKVTSKFNFPRTVFQMIVTTDVQEFAIVPLPTYNLVSPS